MNPAVCESGISMWCQHGGLLFRAPKFQGQGKEKLKYTRLLGISVCDQAAQRSIFF